MTSKPKYEAQIHITYPDYEHVPAEIVEVADELHTATQGLITSLGLTDGASFESLRGRYIGGPIGLAISRPRKETGRVFGGIDLVAMAGDQCLVISEQTNPMPNWRFRKLELFELDRPRTYLRSDSFGLQFGPRNYGGLVVGLRLHTPIAGAEVNCPFVLSLPSLTPDSRDMRALPESVGPSIQAALDSLDLLPTLAAKLPLS